MKRAVTAAILLGSIAASNSQASVTVSPYRPEVGGRYVYFMVADTEAELDATAPPAGAFGWALDTSTLRCYTGSAWQDCATGGGGDGVGYDEVQDEGTPLTKRGKVNFIGSTVSCADNAGSSRTDCTFSGGAGLSDGDYGDVTVSGTGTVMTVDPDAVALGTDTTGNYVSSATASQGLTLTGTEGASLGLQSCTDGQILKNSSGTSWSCAADATGSGGAPYGEYDPDNQATSLGTSGWREEWTGDAASQTWAWGNQDGAAETIGSDSVLLAGDGTDEFHARCTTAVATNADQTVTAKLWIENLANNNNGAGIGVVVAGTAASPTAIEVLYYHNAATDGYLFLGMTSWALAGASTHGSVESFWPIYSVTQVPTFFQLRYTDSSRNLDAWTSFDGKVFRQVGSSTTISADPVAWCYLVRDDGDAVVEWIQNRTDTNRNKAGE